MKPLFASFFQGGFECATHKRKSVGRVDVIAATKHDAHAEADYRMLASVGVRTVRDALRWHLIECRDGSYDWSSFLPMLRAACASGTQVIWDLCHWGVPEGIDPFSPLFINRFERFSAAAAAVIRDHTDEIPFFCPVNEVSFWSWVGGDRGAFFPYASGRAGELKRQLAAATIVSQRAVRSVDSRARFLQCEPIIHISEDPARPQSRNEAVRHTEAQFETWDMIAGRLAPELGGSEDCLDILGCNYYWNNQWQDHAAMTPIGHPQHQPLHEMLTRLQDRYRRPVVLTETGAEAHAALGWLGLICAEAREAIRAGVDLQGVCIYPVMDYPGWDDGRHCHCGIIAVSEDWSTRTLRPNLSAELRLQMEVSTPR